MSFNVSGYCLRLKPGQEIQSALLEFIQTNCLKSSFILSCVGSVTSATIRLANTVTHDHIEGDRRNLDSAQTHHTISPNTDIVKLSGCYEIVSLVGTLSADGCHLHTALSDGSGRVVGGHVMGDMIVFTTAEIVIGNCDGLKFTREMDGQTGYRELVISHDENKS